VSIPEFSPGALRRQIGFVRVLPDRARDALRSRGYQCYLLDEAALQRPGEMETTDSVVLTQTREDPYQVRQDLDRFADLLDYDCRLYVRYVPDRWSQEIVLRALNRLKLPPSGFERSDAGFFGSDWFEGPNARIFGPFVHILLAKDDDWDLLANLITSNPAGRPPNVDLSIEVCDANYKPLKLPMADELLARRAFGNCSSVRLVGKAEGLSGVGAYDALVQLADNVVGGQWPYRYFVKLGGRLKVAREFDKYQMTVLDYVPYHLGPRLRLDRCVLGRSRGLIVSDYVAGAEALRDCARGGRSIPAIGNLFNLTLLAWRRAAEEEQRPLQQALAELLPQLIPEHREPLIRAYGATKTLAELKTLFKEARPSLPVLTGVVHGDLHATNVLVRTNDAVIVDLERIHAGMPILFDAASLEGGLLVDGFIGDRRSAKEFLDSIERLYTAKAFDADDHYCHPRDGSAWFVDSVRQIRMQGRQMERQPRQYGWTLATVLLRKACNPENFRKDSDSEASDAGPLTREGVRALAYVVAERILLGLSADRKPTARR
jgi:hypothetical protein